jgi:hypothetical protein
MKCFTEVRSGALEGSRREGGRERERKKEIKEKRRKLENDL